MKINWKVRIKSPKFWLALIPAIVMVIQIVGSWFGMEIPAEIINEEATKFINAVFYVLIIMGIVTDPTTSGLSDSEQAQTYDKPKKDWKIKW